MYIDFHTHIDFYKNYELQKVYDEIEKLLPKNLLDIPTYNDILY